ncbi:MAG: hypothetical protein P1U89_21400 [Verrucomicrobiales bacterium]|nr:hypothetical protein [Verrucomicrobiales bacterium]
MIVSIICGVHTSSGQPLGVPQDALQIGNFYYKYVHKPGITWTEADVEARKMGGVLATYLFEWESIDDSMKIRSQFLDSLPETHYFWTGFQSKGGRENRVSKYRPSGELVSKRHFINSLRYENGSASLSPGHFFLSPESGGSRYFCLYFREIDKFPMDGFLCEWVVNDSGILQSFKPTSAPGLGQPAQETNNHAQVFSNFKTGKEFHTLKSIGGKQLDGVVHFVSFNSVRIRNKDFEKFDIPFSRLADETVSSLKKLPPEEKEKFNFQSEVAASLQKENSPGRVRSVPKVTWSLVNPSVTDYTNLLLISKVTLITETAEVKDLFSTKVIPKLESKKTLSVSMNPLYYSGDARLSATALAVFSNDREVYSDVQSH